MRDAGNQYNTYKVTGGRGFGVSLYSIGWKENREIQSRTEM